ncbi:GNAT family N-acetyltransferase [Fusibacter bizertensis]
MNIRKAINNDIDSIVSIIDDSDLGSIYFKKDKEKIENMIKSEMDQENIVIGENHNMECVAVLIYSLDGAFGIHPCIHILAVDSASRGRGYGKQLLNYFEEEIVPNYRKILLLVGKWNSRAEKLYENIGFVRLCELDGFYTENVTEILMLKGRKKE